MGKKRLPVYSYDKSIKRALVVVAHPDDVDFGTAGTVAYLTNRGVDVAYCLVTSGDAGGDDSSDTREDRIAIREAEQTEAANEVGVTNLTFLHWPDERVDRTSSSPRVPSATTNASSRVTPTTWRPVRRRCARCIPTRETLTPFPNWFAKGSSPTPSTRSGWAASIRPWSSTSRRPSTRSTPHSASTSVKLVTARVSRRC